MRTMGLSGASRTLTLELDRLRSGSGDRTRDLVLTTCHSKRGCSDQNGHRSQQDRYQSRFKKAYKIALETMADDTSSEDESTASASQSANVAGVAKEEDDDSVNSLAAHASRMYSSLKED